METENEKIIGLDLGTNSVGWAIVNKATANGEKRYSIEKCGVTVFPDSPTTSADRRTYRQQRRHYWRRKIRKIALIKELIKYGYCPHVSSEELARWRENGVYPKSEALREWLRSDEKEEGNPWYYRHLCLTENLNILLETDRYKIGRAFYHINQKRGFRNNRKSGNSDENGVVLGALNVLSEKMKESGIKYVGEYFYQMWREGKKLVVEETQNPKRYTHRDLHCKKEFLAICEKQHIDAEITERLGAIIFNQRPLRSQRQTVGMCVFEKNKRRCPKSHPFFEEYRMYQFLNNIKIKSPNDETMRTLTKEEKEKVIPKFLRKSKPYFDFDDIAKTLAGKHSYSCGINVGEYEYRFNYKAEQRVDGCPVIAQLRDVFCLKGDIDELYDTIYNRYTLSQGKDKADVIDEVWRVLQDTDDDDWLAGWGRDKLGINGNVNDKKSPIYQLVNIRMTMGYASLSHKAINKILPLMKDYGLRYDCAVMIANLPSLIKGWTKKDSEEAVGIFSDYDAEIKDGVTELPLGRYLKYRIAEKYHIGGGADCEQLKKLWHPSQLWIGNRNYNKDNLCPVPIGDLRNPSVHKSLTVVRSLLNSFIKKGLINRETRVIVENSRSLNGINERRAIEWLQRQQEAEKREAIDKIRKVMGDEFTPTSDDITKYRLWREQGEISVYTGNNIPLEKLFDGQSYQLEHTVPQSRGGETIMENLTVCETWYNYKKGTKLPSELGDDYGTVLTTTAHFNTKIKEKEAKVRREKNPIKRKVLSFELNYLRDKYRRFILKETPGEFSIRQGIDNSVIAKYATKWLKHYFYDISTIKGRITSELRILWGLEKVGEGKDRSNHTHHTKDAIVIACADRFCRNTMNFAVRNNREITSFHKKALNKPWPTFSEDVKELTQSILVKHLTVDNVGKQTKRRNVEYSKDTGEFLCGRTARKALHLETVYGKIQYRDKEKVVLRVPIESITRDNVRKVVDKADKTIIEKAINQYGSIDKAIKECGCIWKNEKMSIPIKKVRIFKTDVVNALSIRPHRDVSKHKHKRQQWVKNDSNQLFRIYEETNKKGTRKAKCDVVDQLSFANKKYDPTKKYIHQLRVGDMVLLYQNSPNELYNANVQEINRHLYWIYGFDKSGRIKLQHHQEARYGTELGAIKCGTDFSSSVSPHHRIELRPSSFHALVENTGFILGYCGEIIFSKTKQNNQQR